MIFSSVAIDDSGDSFKVLLVLPLVAGDARPDALHGTSSHRSRLALSQIKGIRDEKGFPLRLAIGMSSTPKG